MSAAKTIAAKYMDEKDYSTFSDSRIQWRSEGMGLRMHPLPNFWKLSFLKWKADLLAKTRLRHLTTAYADLIFYRYPKIHIQNCQSKIRQKNDATSMDGKYL